MSRIPAAVLVLTLLAPGCAGGLSSNQSKGMMYGGGAAVFMGSIVAIDGLTCNKIAGGDQSCEEDRIELRNGAVVIGLGLALGVIGYLLRPQPADESATATTTKTADDPPPVIEAVAAE